MHLLCLKNLLLYVMFCCFKFADCILIVFILSGNWFCVVAYRSLKYFENIVKIFGCKCMQTEVISAEHRHQHSTATIVLVLCCLYLSVIL